MPIGTNAEEEVSELDSKMLGRLPFGLQGEGYLAANDGGQRQTRTVVAQVGNAEFGKPPENLRILTAVTNAIEFGTTHGAEHCFGFRHAHGLTFDEAMVLTVPSEQLWSHQFRYSASRAAPVDNIEGPSGILSVRTNPIGHGLRPANVPGFSCRRPRQRETGVAANRVSRPSSPTRQRRRTRPRPNGERTRSRDR